MKIIIANWKAKITTEADAVALARGSDKEGLVVCPPHAFLDEVRAAIVHASLGAQDYAPDLSARGATHVIIGHSDRRREGETDDVIAEKIALAVSDGLIPILCVGETKPERDAGETHEVLKRQIRTALSRIPAETAPIFIGYEPVWAISTTPGAEPENPTDAARKIAFIREQVSHGSYRAMVSYIYGGSVTATTAGGFLEKENIQGLLVGGASLHEKEITNIWQQAQKA